jgi:anti-sigma B factor antagonist
MSEQLKTASKLVPAARKEGDALVASVSGEIDLNNSPELRAALLGLLAKSPSKKVVLNLAQVPYMDSSAVAVLVELLRKLNGGKLFLTDLQKRVQGLMEVAKLSTIFKIVPTEKEALA